jgi:hypothetical protein
MNTKVTKRSYYTDHAATVLVWGGDLDATRQALKSPAYVLCLGRRSCPLSAPLHPVVVEATSLLDAFSTYDNADPDDVKQASDPQRTAYFFDEEAVPLCEGMSEPVFRERRDWPVSRGPDWSFRPRRVAEARAKA